MDRSPYSIGITFETNDGAQGTYNLRFYSNGTRDNTSDFTEATVLLSPTINFLEADSKQTIDVWEFLNWYMVACYWTFLYQFGDIAPTIYQQDNGNPSIEFIDGQITFNSMGHPNFSAPITALPTNNIFWNEELFEIYSDYLRNTLVPLVLRLYPEFSDFFALPQFLPLDDTNRAQRVPTTLFTSYQCNELVWKGWASALVSILVSIFSLWTTGYGIMVMILTKFDGDVPLRLLG
jgi:hypothetical protein